MEKISLLKEISKDAKMGMDSISTVLNKVKDENFESLLNEQHKEYKNIFDRTQELLVENHEEIEDTPMMQKAMSWMGIQLNTVNDTSNSKLSDLLIQGTNMGIIKGRKLLNSISTTKEIKNILSDFVRLQEKNVEDLKKYL